MTVTGKVYREGKERKGRMNAKRITLLLALLLGAVGANAQVAQDIPIGGGGYNRTPRVAAVGPVINPQSYPGQFWSDTGNVSPTEHNDIISASYFEQGVTLLRTDNHFTITPYVSLGVTADTQGHDWDNRIVGAAGGRLNKYFKYGIVSVGAAYSYEDRWIGNERKGGLTGQVTYWFGWQSVFTPTSRFPGSTWGAAGYLT